jgi:hypothetical protein
METIIQQIMSEWLKNVMNYVDGTGIDDIGKAAKDIREMNNDITNQILRVIVEELDQALVAAKTERKSDGLTIKERDVERTLLLPTGEFTYKRTYFDSGETYAYLVDYLIGVEAYDRISMQIEKELVSLAASVSMQKSANYVTEGKVSRQTVKNKIMNLGEIAIIPERKETTPKELHIFADEDHVSLQDGKNTIVPLITVSEGIRNVSKGRNELKSPIHFQGYAMKPEKQWEYVEAVISNVYATDHIETVYIHGDGASWIAESKTVLPNAKHVLDGFHLNKRMKQLCAGEIGGSYGSRLWTALRKDDVTKFDRYVDQMFRDIAKEYKEDQACKMIESKRDHVNYIMNHWDAIQARFSSDVGSCTEGLVSHILSDRLSRNPMGWSKVGLSKMAMLRVYIKNNGVIQTKDLGADKVPKEEKRIVIRKIKGYETLVKERLDHVVKEATDFSLFEHEPHAYQKTTGTTVLLRSYGKINIAS